MKTKQALLYYIEEMRDIIRQLDDMDKACLLLDDLEDLGALIKYEVKEEENKDAL